MMMVMVWVALVNYAGTKAGRNYQKEQYFFQLIHFRLF